MSSYVYSSELLLTRWQVEHIRSLRNKAIKILKAATAAKPVIIELEAPIISHPNHDAYKSPYQPPAGNKKAAPIMMLFNDDELRFYYEFISVPETKMEREKAKYQYKRVQLELEDDQPLSLRFKNNATDVNASKSSEQSTANPRTLKRKFFSDEPSTPSPKKKARPTKPLSPEKWNNAASAFGLAGKFWSAKK